jgi:hypothetical protein
LDFQALDALISELRKVIFLLVGDDTLKQGALFVELTLQSWNARRILRQ